MPDLLLLIGRICLVAVLVTIGVVAWDEWEAARRKARVRKVEEEIRAWGGARDRERRRG